MEKISNSNNNFETDSLKKFEKLLNGYKRAKESAIWEADIDNLVGKLTHLPTAPFPRKLMTLFDYNYLVLSEPIDTIIEKALETREQMKHTKRYVTIKEKYFNFPFLTPNTHLRKLEIRNNKGELCYLQKGKLCLDLKKLLKWTISVKTQKSCNVLHFKQKTIQYKKLEIYYYSNFVDLTNKNPIDYYEFFTDYYGKVQFMNYFKKKDKINASIPQEMNLNLGTKRSDRILNLTSSQQVLWAYFIFRLMGLKLRLNLEVSILTKFLHLINEIEVSEYRNSYFYKLICKAPYIKEDKKLLIDLEKVRMYFKESNLPIGDIEKMIADLISNK